MERRDKPTARPHYGSGRAGHFELNRVIKVRAVQCHAAFPNSG